ncbi:hypothetical protein EYZ11_010383 [Aspergillus tanneri]|uniref:Ecp2 effector protein domain-containing protein n=1 Tax=Aspergillus tanneri TaxID=1220188 RepID=A0A4S3J5G2_9EURO|nr:uncharacterized protein ATNIH1004_006587 [Aspergillus tanneri]KAA8647885.1 hypothetical protein ATNIH1004_006587 [Aspergillus tanneri]THC90156.1 hypothetical protein EYZ11_010383 [Aspergillus tanneri]
MKLTNAIGLLFTVLTTANPFPLLGLSSGLGLTVVSRRKHHSIESLYGKSDLAKRGGIFATSAQLTDFGQYTGCVIVQDEPEVYSHVNADETWTFLDRGAWVDVKDGYVSCTQFQTVDLPV